MNNELGLLINFGAYLMKKGCRFSCVRLCVRPFLFPASVSIRAGSPFHFYRFIRVRRDRKIKNGTSKCFAFIIVHYTLNSVMGNKFFCVKI